MKSKRDVALEKFLEGYDCAQSVFYAYCDDLGFDKNIALKMTSGFGGGMGGKGEVCGAVVGGIMVIGAKHGRGEEGDRTATNLTFSKTRDFMDQFSDRRGTFICRKLLNGCDLTTREGWNAFRENDLLNKVCVPCIESAIEILENVM
jgi:C_GCAxxG_C_C family probable redox protein